MNPYLISALRRERTRDTERLLAARTRVRNERTNANIAADSTQAIAHASTSAPPAPEVILPPAELGSYVRRPKAASKQHARVRAPRGHFLLVREANSRPCDPDDSPMHEAS